MDRNKLFGFLLAVCLGTCVTFSYAEIIIIIDPDPGDEIILPPDNPPQPQVIAASVDVDPNTLNLGSNRQFITAYIELPAGYVPAQIKTETVKLAAINGQQTAPVPALASPREIGDNDADGIPDLMVKFDYTQLSPLLSAGALTLKICGDLEGINSFAGEDTITAIKEADVPQEPQGKKSIALVPQSGERTQAERQYRYSLNGRLAPGAQIKSVMLWKKAPHAFHVNTTLPAWHYKSHKNWEPVNGKYGDLRYSNVKKGEGYAWDLTNKVAADWSQGISDVIVRVEEGNGDRTPVLVVVYDPPASSAEEAAREGQKLSSVGEKLSIGAASSDALLTFSYSDQDLQGAQARDIAVYYWDAALSQWRQAKDSAVDTAGRTVTCTASAPAVYQVMVARSSIPANPQSTGAANALKQNYPNPFNPATTIKYTIAHDCHVTLKIYNVAGELVATVVDEYQSAGSHSVYYDGGARLSRGIYYYQLNAGGFVSTKRMAVLK